jgi:hypothetical protein
MRHPAGIAAAVLLLLFATTSTCGARTGATTGTGPTGTTGSGYPRVSTSTGAKSDKNLASKTVSGTVISVDDANKSFVVHLKKGTDSTFKTEDKTSYWVGKKKGSWADIKAGVEAKVTYKNDGADNWAIRVKLRSASGTGTGGPGGA